MAGDQFGWSVALSSAGTRMAIGAIGNNGNAGHVRVYDWTENQWTQVGSALIGEAADDEFGSSVALSSDGTRVAIGASGKDGNGVDAGRVRLYDWTESEWTQVGADLNGEDYVDAFGWSVSLSSDGTRVAIGTPFNDGNGLDAGHVRVYDWTETQWMQVGSDLNGQAKFDEFGTSVALSTDGTRVAIGASGAGENTDGAGYVRVYVWTGSQWTQVGSDLYGEMAFDEFGWSVALSSEGTRLAIGAPYNDANGNDAGHVRVFDWTGSQWTPVGSDLNGEAAYDYLGWSVALSSDGTRVAIGAPTNGYSSDNAGHVRLYDWTGSQWTQVGSALNQEASGDHFGRSVALSSDGTRVAIGAIPFNDGNGDGAGQVRVYDVSA